VPKRVRQPCKWHGGKYFLSSWFHEIAQKAPHKHRVHLCAGGLAEAWEWPSQGVSVVVNDLHGYLINFYRVLQDSKLFAAFQRQVAAIPFARMEWDKANEQMTQMMAQVPASKYRPSPPNVEVAVAFFVWNRQSMAGRMDSFSPLTKTRTRGDRNAEVNAWLATVHGLPEVKSVLDSWVIEHDGDIRVLRREDSKDTLFYWDPTYLMGEEGEGRTTENVYHLEHTFSSHEKIIKELVDRPLKGKMMLSGYRSKLYDDNLTTKRGWTRHDKIIDNKAQKTDSGGAKRKMVECVYTNF
jgi:DNA adenine methylase